MIKEAHTPINIRNPTRRITMKANELTTLHQTTALRTKMIDTLIDSDLAFKLPNNPTLGELCVYMGNVERAYIDSFKTRKLVWGKNNDEGLGSSVEKLKAWYKALDEEFDTVLNAIPGEDFSVVYPAEGDGLENTVDRGWPMPLGGQFRAYREALFIFCGKCDVYLHALGKPLSEQWQGWIG
jgi:hypothetical protein